MLSPRIKADSKTWRFTGQSPIGGLSVAIMSPRIKMDLGTVEIAKEQLQGGYRASELTQTRRGITESWTPVTYPMYRTFL
ncbi:hypothetical protein TNCV_2983291 [Trichonephila clavipes]|nr:hypothetical protein TNCV_2983291 [Trichonephila clavipes]